MHLAVVFDLAITFYLCAVARSVARPLGIRATPRSTPKVRHIISLRFGYAIFLLLFLPIPPIREEQLLANGKITYTKYK